MIHKEISENNYLTIIKLILEKPGKAILSRYLSLQTVSLLNNQTSISFLTFYNFMGLPFEISSRLYNILLSLSNQKDVLSKKDFIYGLSLFYSNSFIDDKLNAAFCFLTNTNIRNVIKVNKNKMIYKQDILTIFRLFHYIDNDEMSFFELNEIIDSIFKINNSMTYQQFENKCISDPSLLFLILIYFTYYQPFTCESLNFYVDKIYNEINDSKKSLIDDIEFTHKEKSRKYGQPQSLLYVYLYYNFDMKNLEIEKDLDDLNTFEKNLKTIRDRMVNNKIVNRFHCNSSLGLKAKFFNKYSLKPNARVPRLPLSKTIIVEPSSNNLALFTGATLIKQHKIQNKSTRETSSQVDNQSISFSQNKTIRNRYFHYPSEFFNDKLKLGKTVITESTTVEALSGMKEFKHGKTINTEHNPFLWKKKTTVENLSLNLNGDVKTPLISLANEESFSLHTITNENKNSYNTEYIFYVIFKKKDAENINYEMSSNYSNLEELYELSKFKMNLFGNDIYTFKYDHETNTYIFNQIITLKGLYIEEGSQSEQIVDTENKAVYYSVHLISTIQNKIQNTIIFLDNKQQVDKLIQTIQKITNYRSLQDYYEITNLLAKRKNGVVVKAIDKRTGLFVAIKIVEKNYKNIQNIYILRNEIDILKLVSKLNIQQLNNLKEIFENYNTIYLIQDYYNCGDLGKLVTKKIMFCSNERKMNLIISILRQLTVILKALKLISVLHFDIRKENIVCNVSNNIFKIKLIDFGTSKIYFHEQKIYGQLGTLAYLPPEIIKGEKYSEKTDIWALGVLAYYLLYGVQLFEGNSINEVKNNIVSLQIPIDTTNQDKQFQQINKLIVRCLERDKHKRAKIEEISTFL